VNKYKIALLSGDGVSAELIESASLVLQAAAKSGSFELQFHTYPYGKKAYDQCGEACPADTLAGIQSSAAALLGAVCVKGIPSPSPIGFLRKELNLFADVRPVRSFPGVWSLRPDIDMVCIRETTEGFIADRNLYKGYGEFMPNEDQVLSLRVISRQACERIAKFAFEYARKNNRKKITALHKANVLKMGCGLFLESVQKIAAGYPDIELCDESVDSAAGGLIRNPENYDVLLTTNLFGDILSDEAAGLVSSLVPTGNFGTSTPMFMPIDHSPQYSQERKGTINPLGIILCASMLLEHLGELTASNSVKRAIAEHLKAVALASLSTDEIARDICERL